MGTPLATAFYSPVKTTLVYNDTKYFPFHDDIIEFDSACSFLILRVESYVAHMQIQILQELPTPCKMFSGPGEKVGTHVPTEHYDVTSQKTSKLVMISPLQDTD
jgi:hypothetical protein